MCVCQVGEGGQGLVWKGVWKSAPVAIKMLRQVSGEEASKSNEAELRRALLKEANTLRCACSSVISARVFHRSALYLVY